MDDGDVFLHDDDVILHGDDVILRGDDDVILRVHGGGDGDLQRIAKCQETGNERVHAVHIHGTHKTKCPEYRDARGC